MNKIGSTADESDYDSSFSSHDSNHVFSHHCFPAQGQCILRVLHSGSKPVTGQYEIREGNVHMSWIAPTWLPQS